MFQFKLFFKKVQGIGRCGHRLSHHSFTTVIPLAFWRVCTSTSSVIFSSSSFGIVCIFDLLGIILCHRRICCCCCNGRKCAVNLLLRLIDLTVMVIGHAHRLHILLVNLLDYLREVVLRDLERCATVFTDETIHF